MDLLERIKNYSTQAKTYTAQKAMPYVIGLALLGSVSSCAPTSMFESTKNCQTYGSAKPQAYQKVKKNKHGKIKRRNQVYVKPPMFH